MTKNPTMAFSLSLLAVVMGMFLASTQNTEASVMIFGERNNSLETAINMDSPNAIREALAGGAQVNARGVHKETPLEYAIGTGRQQAAEELLRHGADPSLRDNEGDNAMCMAVMMFKKMPDILPMLVKGGGDPNSRLADGNPIIVGFVNDHNLEGLRVMKALGADIDIRGRDGRPLIVRAALMQEWDVVWTLLQLGAHYDYSTEPNNVAIPFKVSRAVPPDSPLWTYKVQVWKFLKEHGIQVPPLGN